MIIAIVESCRKSGRIFKNRSVVAVVMNDMVMGHQHMFA